MTKKTEQEQKIAAPQKIALELDQDTYNIIMTALMELPAKTVIPVINNITGQVKAQVENS